MAKRRNFTDQFKARVALEALRVDKTVQEIAAKHQLHPNQVSTWKRQAEVVLLFRPDCSPVKVDQGFTSGCHFHGFGFAGMDLIRGQDVMGRVGPLGVVIGQPSPDTLPGV